MNCKLNIFLALSVSVICITLGQRRSVVKYDVPVENTKFMNTNNNRKESKDDHSSAIDPRSSVPQLVSTYNEEQSAPSSRTTNSSSRNHRPNDNLSRTQLDDGFPSSVNREDGNIRTNTKRFESSADINKEINHDSRNTEMNSRSTENHRRTVLVNSEIGSKYDGELNIRQYGKSLNSDKVFIPSEEENLNFSTTQPDISQYGKSLNSGKVFIPSDQEKLNFSTSEPDISQYGRSLGVGVSYSINQERNRHQNTPSEADVSQYGRSMNTGSNDYKKNQVFTLENTPSNPEPRLVHASSTEKTIFNPEVHNPPRNTFSDNQKVLSRNETRLASVDSADGLNSKLRPRQESPIFQNSKDIIESQIYLNDRSTSSDKAEDKVVQYPVFDPRKTDGADIRPNERRGTIH